MDLREVLHQGSMSLALQSPLHFYGEAALQPCLDGAPRRGFDHGFVKFGSGLAFCFGVSSGKAANSRLERRPLHAGKADGG